MAHELTFSHVTKVFGSKTALNDVSFTLTPGIYGLLGPNGAGKSTMMNLISGNLLADQGQITWNGTDICKLGDDFRRMLGFMPQQQDVYPNFTGIRFLSYIAALKGMKRREAREQIRFLLERVGLNEQAGQKLRTYSGGMKQRILIAQALLAHPTVLVMDEPTAGLDPKQRIAIRNMISELSRDRIVLIATHVVSDVETIAKEIILLRDGDLLRKNSVEALLAELEGKVFDVKATERELPDLAQYGRISTMSRHADGLRVRVLSDQPLPETITYTRNSPTLEDVYLYWFGDEG